MRIRATLTLRNDALLEAASRAGLTHGGKPSMLAVARAAKVQSRQVYAIARLEFDDVTEDALVRVSAVLGCQPDDLVPPDARGQRFESRFETCGEVSLDRIAAMSNPLSLPRTESVAEAKEFAQIALDAMTDRQRQVVTLREQGMSLAEIGKQLGLSRDRVWQIEGQGHERARKALRAKGVRSAEDISGRSRRRGVAPWPR